MGFIKLNRRYFLISSLFAFVAFFLKFLPGIFIFNRFPSFIFIRPPGTTDDAIFLNRCIRCRACANVCEAGCIKFFTLSDSSELVGTPYLSPRQRSCNLCMNCTDICPTGALVPIERDIEVIKTSVLMGEAEVITTNCLSFNGRVCGVCHDACPTAAIQLLDHAQPTIQLDLCIGCGRCEEWCPQYPTAIKVRRKDLNYA